MPPRPSRKASDANAGPGPVREAPVVAVPASAPTPASEPTVKPRKFTALLDAETDSRYGRLLDALRESAGPVATRADGNGRTRAGYDLSRADLLRALLQVADEDPTVMTEVAAKVRSHYGATA